MFISSRVARIKRHAPRCDLQACHRARSRLNSACTTRFCNAILADQVGIPIVREKGRIRRTLAGLPCEEESPRRRSLSHFLRFRFHLTLSSSFSLLYPSFLFSRCLCTLLHPHAKCKTRVESLERSCEKRSTLADAEREGEERAGVPLMAGNNRMIFSSPVLRRRRIS